MMSRSGNAFFRASIPFFVAPHPGAIFSIVLVQEHHLELAGLAEDVQLVQQRLTAGLWLQRKPHGVGLRQTLISSHSLARFSGTWLGVDWQASEYR